MGNTHRPILLCLGNPRFHCACRSEDFGIGDDPHAAGARHHHGGFARPRRRAGAPLYAREGAALGLVARRRRELEKLRAQLASTAEIYGGKNDCDHRSRQILRRDPLADGRRRPLPGCRTGFTTGFSPAPRASRGIKSRECFEEVIPGALKLPAGPSLRYLWDGTRISTVIEKRIHAQY